MQLFHLIVYLLIQFQGILAKNFFSETLSLADYLNQTKSHALLTQIWGQYPQLETLFVPDANYTVLLPSEMALGSVVSQFNLTRLPEQIVTLMVAHHITPVKLDFDALPINSSALVLPLVGAPWLISKNSTSIYIDDAQVLNIDQAIPGKTLVTIDK